MTRRRTPATPEETRRRTGETARDLDPRGAERRVTIERVQTGVRMEKRMLLVCKALAGALDMTFGDLLEGIVLHVFEGKAPFGPDTLAKIDALKAVYGFDLTAADSHVLVETGRRKRADD